MKPLETAARGVEPLWVAVKQLFTQHDFLTIVCGFILVAMVISFYRFLRSISPALIYLVLGLMLVVLVLHWTQTRTEPRFLKPMIDALAPYFPAPVYRGNQ